MARTGSPVSPSAACHALCACSRRAPVCAVRICVVHTDQDQCCLSHVFFPCPRVRTGWGRLNAVRGSDKLQMFKPSVGALRDHVEDFVAGVQEELGMLDELRYEWRRLQTFVEWPLERPRPAELAKAGFFFSPCQDEPDRCAHFCSDKFFSAWEPNDDPWEVLCANCPESPFVQGLSDNVPLPSAYTQRNAYQTQAPEDSDDDVAVAAVQPDNEAGAKKAETGRGGGLATYLSNAVAKVGTGSSIDSSAAEQARQGEGHGGERELGSTAGTFGAYNVDASSAGSDEVAAKVRLRKGKKGGAGGKGKNTLFSDISAHGKVWGFEGGGGGGEEFPVAGDNDSDDMPRSKMTWEEWERVCLAAGQAVVRMQSRWDAGMAAADNKMQALTDKTARLHARTKVLLRPDALAPLRAQIAALVVERADAEAKAALAKEKLEALGAEFKGREAELEELRNAEAVKDEWERKVRESAEEVEELQDTRARLEEEISSLEDSKQELVLCVSVCCGVVRPACVCLHARMLAYVCLLSCTYACTYARAHIRGYGRKEAKGFARA